MKAKIKLLIIAFFLISSVGTSPADTNINELAEYYSQLLSSNLNQIIDLTKSLNQLSEKPGIEKEYLETKLITLDNKIKDANQDIANMVKYIPKENLERIQKYLDNIDEHLAQVYVDIQILREKLNSNEQVNIASLVSDIYYQVNQAENDDHLEIKKIQNYMNDN